jgi:hypothetical protein
MIGQTSLSDKWRVMKNSDDAFCVKNNVCKCCNVYVPRTSQRVRGSRRNVTEISERSSIRVQFEGRATAAAQSFIA